VTHQCIGSELGPSLKNGETQQDAAQIIISLRELIYLYSTSNAFRLIISDILVLWWEVMADMAANVANVAAAVEHCAEQLEEAIRPDSGELTGDCNAEGGIGIPSLEHLTQPVENARDQASRPMKETTAEASRQKDHLWNNIPGDNSDRVKTRVLDRIQEVIL
jgi:hypothetical protein